VVVGVLDIEIAHHSTLAVDADDPEHSIGIGLQSIRQGPHHRAKGAGSRKQRI
jgi:hypothetical protein